jgi:LysR family hydrogen peroxide-inducible transcriptional activator
MISPQQIAYILSVVETRSISKAAENCFVTQPTLSMQLKKAEELLGHAVFYRDGTSWELTDFGKDLIPLLRQIQGEFGEITRLKETFSGTYSERLRIGVIPTVAAYLLLDSFGEWKNSLPTTQVFVEELKTEELLDALDQRKIDLAILAGPVDSTNLRVVPLFTEEILAYAPETTGEHLLVDELQNLQPWLLNKGNCLRTQMMHFCSINEDENNHWNYQGGNMDLLMRMVDQQGGYTLIPKRYEHYIPAQSALKTIEDHNGNHPGRSIIAVSAFRHSKWSSMEIIIRSIQLKYNQQNQAKLEMLDWK